MTGASMKVEVIGEEKVRRRLDNLVRAGGYAAPLMRDIGEYVLNATRDRFDEGSGQRSMAPFSDGARRATQTRASSATAT